MHECKQTHTFLKYWSCKGTGHKANYMTMLVPIWNMECNIATEDIWMLLSFSPNENTLCYVHMNHWPKIFYYYAQWTRVSSVL